nr:hypothetical protein [Megavirus caiporensis]
MMRRATTIGQKINPRVNFVRISSLCTSIDGFKQSHDNKFKTSTKNQIKANNEKSKKKDTYEDYSDSSKPNKSYVPFAFGLSDYFHFSSNTKSSKSMNNDATESNDHWDFNDSGSDD